MISILTGSAIAEYLDSKSAHLAHSHSSTSSSSLDSFGLPHGPNLPEEGIPLAALICFMVGFMTFLLGFFRLGFLDSVLSRALLRGFICAVAAVIVIEQSPTLCGIRQPPDHGPDPFGRNDTLILSPIEKLVLTVENLHNSHIPTTLISIASISFLLFMSFIKKRWSDVRWLQVIPEILILVLTTVILSWFFDWESQGVKVLQVTKSGFITPRIPRVALSKIQPLALTAALISIIGFVESIVISKQYAQRHHYPVSPNRELVALGTANLIGSLFGSFPAFGSLARSSINDRAGAKTQMSGIISAFVILATIKWFLPFFYFLPRPVCASIIFVAATRLVDLKDVYFIIRLRAYSDLFLLLLTFALTLILSIELGTLLSVSLSLLMVIKHTTVPRISLLHETKIVDPSTGQVKLKWVPSSTLSNIGLEDKHDGSKGVGISGMTTTTGNGDVGEGSQGDFIGVGQDRPGIIVVKLEEGLFFGNVEAVNERVKRVQMFGGLGIHPGEDPKKVLYHRHRILSGSGGTGVTGGGPMNGSGYSPKDQYQRKSDGEIKGKGQGGDISPGFDFKLSNEEEEEDHGIRVIILDIGSVTHIDAR